MEAREFRPCIMQKTCKKHLCKNAWIPALGYGAVQVKEDRQEVVCSSGKAIPLLNIHHVATVDLCYRNMDLAQQKERIAMRVANNITLKKCAEM